MRDSDKPIFSVVIPTYNRAYVLSRAIQSVLNQALADFELLVVDDGSTDATAAVVRAFADPRLRYIYQENKGRSAARNTGAAQANGEFITFLDSDDEAEPDWLAAFVRSFQQADRAGVVCGGVRIITEGRSEETLFRSPALRAFFPEIESLFLAGAFSLRRELFTAIEGYEACLAYSENTELALRLIPYCLQTGWQIIAVNKPLVIYHKQPFDGSEPPENRRLRVENIKYIIDRHRDKFAKNRPGLGHFWAVAGVNAVRLGQYREARRYFGSAIMAHPQNWKHYIRFFLTLAPILGNQYWTRYDQQS